MVGMSKKQRDYWFPIIEKKQRTQRSFRPIYKKSFFGEKTLIGHQIISGGSGEYCSYCGVIPATLEKLGLDPIMMISHDDNNRYNNTLQNLSFTCRGCNRKKDPHKPIHERRQISRSEATNMRAEKPWVDWLYEMVREGKTIEWSFAVAEGAFKFDISTDTIEKRYYRKYFEAPSGPFELLHNQDLGKDVVILKDLDVGRTNETLSPTPPIETTDQ